MTTVAGLAEAVASATHVPKAEVCQRIRALRETGLLPTAPSRHSLPHVTSRQAILLLLAVLRGGPIKDTVEHASSYAALREDENLDWSLAWLLEFELDEIRSGRSLFEELLLIEDPLAASVRYSDGWVKMNDGEPVRYATRLISFPRAGLEKLAHALD